MIKVPGILEKILSCLTNIIKVAERDEIENEVEKYEKIYFKEWQNISQI